jgi:two-component sensor histidine kinase
VLALLSLALLPLGAIATWQTQRSATEAARNSEATLLALTERAATPLQAALSRASGLAAGVSQALPTVLDDPRACSAFLARVLAEEPAYSYLAFVPLSGVMDCSSDGRVYDFSGFESFRDTMENPRRRVTVNRAAPMSGTSVLIVSEPVSVDGRFLGTLSVSLPHERLDATLDLPAFEGPLSITTMNPEGDVLTALLDEEERVRLMPQGAGLRELAEGGARAFSDFDAGGQRRAYAVVPIVEGTVYALASWPQDALVRTRLDRLVATGLMPLLMWAASLAVAFVALDRLVIRHIRLLSRQLRAFARTRRLVARPLLSGAGAELADIEEDFREMAGAILQDEAGLENALRQKNRLLKEVHHRVKNNLQLISSVINMQVRKTRAPEAAGVLRRLQDRIMSIATVHRSLYQSEDLERVDAGRLVEEVARQILAGAQAERPGLSLELTTAPISLDADQAVPVSLLVSEAMTNAVRHTPHAGASVVRLGLTEPEPGAARLVIENPAATDEELSFETGLGLGVQLIRAFVSQLGGKIEVKEGNPYRLQVDFKVRDEAYRPLDY